MDIEEEERKGEKDEFIMLNKKQSSFIDLAKKRMPKLLKMMKLVENLSNTYHYQYDDKQSQKIIGDIEAALRDIKHSYRNGLDKQSRKNQKEDDYEI